jgi:predicted nucleic acid-binding protein
VTGIFVDTSAWYALVDSDDADHGKAAAFFSANTTPLITTNTVFSETVTLIRYRLGHEPARIFGQKMKESSFVRLVPITQTDEERAWDSFAVMQRMKLTTAFTFDSHFRVMKFVVAPG